MSDINFGTQGRNECLGFCKKVSVCKLERGEYLMRRHDFGKNSLLARAMEEDTSTFARAPKNGISAQSRPPHNPPTPMWVAEHEIILFQIRKVLLECGYTPFSV